MRSAPWGAATNTVQTGGYLYVAQIAKISISSISPGALRERYRQRAAFTGRPWGPQTPHIACMSLEASQVARQHADQRLFTEVDGRHATREVSC